MKTLDKLELSLEERNEITELFANWLQPYTHEVIVRVMEKREEIINNEFAMNLLRELKTRSEKEEKDFAHSVGHLLFSFDDFKEFDPHNHPLSHAKSYRDILHDMYIRK